MADLKVGVTIIIYFNNILLGGENFIHNIRRRLSAVIAVKETRAKYQVGYSGENDVTKIKKEILRIIMSTLFLLFYIPFVVFIAFNH